MEKGGYLRFQLLQEVCVIGLQTVYLAHPIACFTCINDNGQILVVGAQHEFGEECNLVTVFAFGFHLVGKCGAEVLQPLAVLPAVEQYLVHHDEQFSCPVGIELAAEILVGVESHIVLKKGFQKVQEGAFARVAFFRHQQQDRQLLNRLQVEQLQIVHPQLVLFPEDVPYQRLDMR